MKQMDLISKLSAFKGASKDNARKLIIDNILDLVKTVPNEELEKFSSVQYFEQTEKMSSALSADVDSMLQQMLEELRAWNGDAKQQIKDAALVGMRTARRGPVVAAIILLSALAAVAAVLGVLGAFNVVPNVCCDIIGVADCVFGISFFIYEMYSDKLKESQISNGDKDTLKKYASYIKIKISSGNKNKHGTQINGVWNLLGMSETDISKAAANECKDQLSNLIDLLF